MISNAPEHPFSTGPDATRPAQAEAPATHAAPSVPLEDVRLTLGPGLPVIEAAHLVLAERFDAVARALEALRESPQGVRETHALRVATRRAAAALSVFQQHLDPDRARKAKRGLRRLRHAAGTVRVRDVEEELLLAAARGTPNAAGLTPLDNAAVVAAELMLARVSRKRAKAIKRMLKGRADYTPDHARRAADRLNASLHAARERIEDAAAPAFRHAQVAPNAAHAARAAVRDAAQALHAASDHASGSGDFDSLHRMRLAGKRLRYIIEVMAPCLDEDASERALALLRKLQDRLGEINDRHELARRTAKAADSLGLIPAEHTGGRTAQAFSALRHSLLAERDSLFRDFAEWWSDKRPRLDLALFRLASDSPPATTLPAPPHNHHAHEPSTRTTPPATARPTERSALLALELNEAIDCARGLLQSTQREARA